MATNVSTSDNATENTTITLTTKARALLHLTRWREHVPFTIPLTVVGALLAITQHGAALDGRLLFVTLANILAMSFAFMINDVEDAPDDALNPRKRARNPVSNGTLTYREGMWAAGLTTLAALLLYALGGGWAFGLGALTVALCYLYSAHPFRLKARPVTDIVSHVLMLSGLLIMVGYFTYHQAPGIAWTVIAAAILFSAYGQFYNQLDDYEVDKAAGLRNTVVLLGRIPTMVLMYGAALGAMACMGLAILSGVFPAWLGIIVLITIFISLLFKWDTDMRGNQADTSGQVQKPALFIANMVALIWLAQAAQLLPIA